MVGTGLSEDNFAIACPFTVDEILDLNFYPNATDILIDAGSGVLVAVKCLQNLKASSALAISIITQMELMVDCRNKVEL